MCYLPDLLEYLGVDRKGFDTISNHKEQEDDVEQDKPTITFIENVGYVSAIIGEELKPIIPNPKTKENFLTRIKRVLQNLKGTEK